MRADGIDLRGAVVGEGGNLGLTQLGRIEYARTGGRINTDAIDNSAGVDTSDHEVNLKILLDRSVASGAISRDERNALLASVTDDVAALVLRDNYEQNVLLGMARKLSPALISVHQRFIQELEKAGELDRAIEFLPSDKEIAQREAEGVGLFSPENSVLVAYSKDDAHPAHRGLHAAGRAVVPARAGRVLPGGDRRTLRRRPGQSPAAPGDHHHRRRQRHDQPQWHHVRAPRDRGDRRRHRPDHAGVRHRARGLRPAGAVGRHRGARQRGAHRRPARRLSGDPPAHRPGDALARRRAVPADRRRRRDRALRADGPGDELAHHRAPARCGAGQPVHRGRPPCRSRPAPRTRAAPRRAAQRVSAARRRRDRQRQ